MAIKILVVDDEPHLRTLYQEELRPEGYSIVTSDGQEPIMAVIKRENPDLVLLDIKLANVSGLDLLQSIRAEDGSLPVILSTAYDSFQYDLKSIAADAYCVKSVDLTILKDAIRSVLSKKGIA